ncbi:hypothetical protein [Holospora curviuscula]|uniref:hypothetical protein n=1 Tax=Holospora curviuscula TaxID=1082868 RepID=UPI001A9C5513|nr:hypothetical protein [Holospora curviuscula]
MLVGYWPDITQKKGAQECRFRENTLDRGTQLQEFVLIQLRDTRANFRPFVQPKSFFQAG